MPREYHLSAPIAVYRMFNAAGDLLYIGQSINPAQRLCLHRTVSSWLTEVASMSLEWHPTREAAKAAEAAAIFAEVPAYNIDRQADSTARRIAARKQRGAA